MTLFRPCRGSPRVGQDPAISQHREHWEQRWRKDAVWHQEEALHGNVLYRPWRQPTSVATISSLCAGRERSSPGLWHNLLARMAASPDNCKWLCQALGMRCSQFRQRILVRAAKMLMIVTSLWSSQMHVAHGRSLGDWAAAYLEDHVVDEEVGGGCERHTDPVIQLVCNRHSSPFSTC